MIRIKKIEIFRFSLLIAIFEFWNLLFLSLIYLKNSFVYGFIVGLLGGFLAILTFNILRINIRLYSKKVLVLNKIDYFIPSLANGFFLGILFFSQNFISLPKNFIGLALLGFLSVLITLLFCFTLYNLMLVKINIKVGGFFSSKHFFIKKINILSFSIYAALFEFFIMPFMGLFLLLFKPFPNFISFPVSGFLAGLLGSLIGCLIYNFFTKFRIGFKIK